MRMCAENPDKLYFDRICIQVVISSQKWGEMLRKLVQIEDGTKKKPATWLSMSSPEALDISLYN